MSDMYVSDINPQSIMQATEEGALHMNGISNGHHLQHHNNKPSNDSQKSADCENRHKSKHRDKEYSTHHHRSSSKSTHKSSNRDRDKHHGSSSGHGRNESNKEQQQTSSSSSKSKHRNKHNDGNIEKIHHHHHHHTHHHSHRSNDGISPISDNHHEKLKKDSLSTSKGVEMTNPDSGPVENRDLSQQNQHASESTTGTSSSSSHSHRQHSQSKSSSSSSSKEKSHHHHKEKLNSKHDSHRSHSSSSSRKHSGEKSQLSATTSTSSSSSSSSSTLLPHDKERRDHEHRRHKSSSSSSSKSKHKHSSSSSHHKHDRSSSTISQSLPPTSPPQQQVACNLQDGEFLKPAATVVISNNVTREQLQNGAETIYVSNRDISAAKYSNGKDYMNNSETRHGTGFETISNSSMKMEDCASLNISEVSSCDYSLSQFNDDEPPFKTKREAAESNFEGIDQSSDENERKLEVNNLNDGESDNDLENDSMSHDDDSGGNENKLNHCQQHKQQELVPSGGSVHIKMEVDSMQGGHTLEDEEDDEENLPLLKRKIKLEEVDIDEDELPLLARKKLKQEGKMNKSDSHKKKKKRIKEERDDFSSQPSAGPTTTKRVKKEEISSSPAKRGKKVKQEEDNEVWRWWEEEKREDGVKWTTLEHKGPVFAPPYERLPRNVRFFYDGCPMELSEGTEEVATFYAKMLNHDYCTRDIFNENFFKDFRKIMTSQEREIIKDFRKCNFEEMHKYFLAESEKRKNATKEEKLAKKMENEALIKEYGVCMIDGHKEKIGNFRLEPPGLFRGRGEHPKMGMIKRRIQAEDVSINCGKDSRIPQAPEGHRWREVVHNNTVTWLASWVENVQGQVKYIMLNPSSKLKGEKDHVKYETARRLDKCIEKIRNTYRDEWKSKEMRVRQRAVALYFIDKLALRAGNEKDEDQADTVGCCSLRVEHVALHKELNGKEYVVVFDFLGKDSIRYYNEVQVERRVFKNLELFVENKKKGDDLFDRLNTQVLNEHLKELMEGLTAKVFRTYNASITLQNQLDLLTKEDMTVPEKLLAYNRANRAVAILCNHQRSVPKSHEKSMETLKEKIRLKTQMIKDCESELKDLKKLARSGSVKEKINADKKAKQLERLKEQLKKLELQETDRDENKTIALGTSKLNYLDPRISVAWCKKFDVPIEKIFNKTQRNKFMWAIHMADKDYRF